MLIVNCNRWLILKILLQNAGERSPKQEDIAVASTSPEEERKDLRALIGLELVVDYVKEPKGDTSNEQISQVTE